MKKLNLKHVAVIALTASLTACAGVGVGAGVGTAIGSIGGAALNVGATVGTTIGNAVATTVSTVGDATGAVVEKTSEVATVAADAVKPVIGLGASDSSVTTTSSSSITQVANAAELKQMPDAQFAVKEVKHTGEVKVVETSSPTVYHSVKGNVRTSTDVEQTLSNWQKKNEELKAQQLAEAQAELQAMQAAVPPSAHTPAVEEVAGTAKEVAKPAVKEAKVSTKQIKKDVKTKATKEVAKTSQKTASKGVFQAEMPSAEDLQKFKNQYAK